MGNYYLYRLGQILANALPYQLSLNLVILICDLHYLFFRKDRESVENNLKNVLKLTQVPKAQVREVFHSFGRYLLEFFTMTKRLNAGFIEGHVKVLNIEYLNDVLQKGKGGIIVSAHLGNWEMGGAVLPMLGFPLSVVALSHKDPKVNSLFNAQREAFGAVVIQTDAAVRRVVEHLKRNRLVAILADRDFGNRGITMDFLGRQVMIPKGATFFSLKEQVPIIPVFFLRRQNQDFEIKIYPPLEPPFLADGKLTDEVVHAYSQQFLSIMEREIQDNPLQWLLFREFWQS